MEKITIKQAYEAMFLYLNKLYDRTKSDDLAGFLSSMSLLEDGAPADSAVWNDWLESVGRATTKSNDINLNLTQKGGAKPETK